MLSNTSMLPIYAKRSCNESNHLTMVHGKHYIRRRNTASKLWSKRRASLSMMYSFTFFSQTAPSSQLSTFEVEVIAGQSKQKYPKTSKGTPKTKDSEPVPCIVVNPSTDVVHANQVTARPLNLCTFRKSPLVFSMPHCGSSAIEPNKPNPT